MERKIRRKENLKREKLILKKKKTRKIECEEG